MNQTLNQLIIRGKLCKVKCLSKAYKITVNLDNEKWDDFRRLRNQLTHSNLNERLLTGCFGDKVININFPNVRYSLLQLKY